jgi:hypothetical protein
MNLFLSTLALITFSNAALADSNGTLCRKTYNPVLNEVIYSNQDLASTEGEALPFSCVEYFVTHGKTETLPLVRGKPANVSLLLDVLPEDFDAAARMIMDNTPAKRTGLSLVFSFPESGNGTVIIRAKLSPKPNYAADSLKSAFK